VFNASDLANGNLAFAKQKKDKNKEEEPVVTEEKKPEATQESARKNRPEQQVFDNNISVYPNPVTEGSVRVAFNDLPAGQYELQLLDLGGKLVRMQEITLNSSKQVTNFSIPEVAKGSYLLKVFSESNKVSVTNKLVVQ
jgi:hypothetical protein